MQELPPGFELDVQPQTAPGVIQGRPAEIKPIDRERLDNDQERIDIAERTADRADRVEGRGAIGEQQSFVLATRIGGGIDDLNDIFKSVPSSANSPNLGEAILYNNFGPNSVVTRGLTDDGRKLVEDVQMDILDALLTMGTGAAYNAEQLEGQRAAYFPQFNDSDLAIQIKRKRLSRLFDAAKRRAGPLAEDLEGYRGAILGPAGEQIEEATRRDEAPAGVQLRVDGLGEDNPFDRAQYLQENFGIDAGTETRLVGMLNANIGNPNLNEEMLASIYSTAGVPPPSPQDMAAMLVEMREGRAPATGIDTSAARKQYEAGLDQVLEREGVDPSSTVDTAQFGAARGLTLGFSDEITGAGNALGAAVTGGDPIAAYQASRDAVRRFEDRSKEESPIASFGSEIAGALLTGGVAAGGVRTVSQAARVGAAEGAIAGAGAGRDLTSTASNAAFGAGLGLAGGAAFQAAGNRASQALTNRRNARLSDNATEVADAGARRSVTTRRVDVDPTVREARGRVGQTQEGRQAINEAASADIAEIETALVRDLGGSTTTRTQGGEAVQQGVKARIDGLRNEAKPLYRQAQAQAGNVRHTPEASLARIDQHMAELVEGGRQGNKAKIDYLQGLRNDITQDGGLSIDGLRMRRSNLSKDLEGAGVYTGDFERRVGDVLDGVSEDIGKSLEAFPEAAQNYAEADNLWRQQAELRRNIGDQLLGKNADLGAGQAATRVINWAKSDPRRLMTLLDEAPAETRDEVRALVAGQLGRLPNGQFQLGAFLKATGSGDGAKLSMANMRVLFGQDGVEAIKDLRVLAQAKSEAAGATNYSNTGSSVRRAAGSFRRMLLGAFGFSAVDGTGAAALAGGGAMIGGEIVEKLGTQRAIRMLLDPTFTQALKTAPNTNKPQAIDRWFGTLRRSATRNPALLLDLDALQRGLIDIANDNASKIAATGGAQEDAGEVKQNPSN